MINLNENKENRELIYTIPNANLYRLSGKNKITLAENRPIEILHYPNEKLYVLNMDLTRYTLSKEIPFLREGKTLKYTFPDVDTEYLLELKPDTTPTDVNKFEEILKKQASLITNIPKEPNVVAKSIYKSANFIKWTFVRTGQLIAFGVGKVGGFVISKIPRIKKDTEIPRIEKAADVTKDVTQDAKNLKENAIEFGSSKAADTAKSVGVKTHVKKENFIVQTGRAIIHGGMIVMNGLNDAKNIVCIV